MDSNNFINHHDPTRDISKDLDEVTLEKQYAKLTDTEKDYLMCKFLGMNRKPVDIMTFISDDYFLGVEGITNHGRAVFDYWKKNLVKMFPNPFINRYCYYSYGGSIGTGKSFVGGKLVGLYNYHKLLCCRNIYTTLGVASSAKIVFGFFHASAETAYKDFYQVYKDWMEMSPYFKNAPNKSTIRLVSSGPRSTGAVLGSQLIFCVLSELGFWKPSDALNKMNEVLIRYNSRFADVRHYFGGVVCDSSAKSAEFGASQKFEESVPQDELFKVSPSHWEVRPEMYRESKGKYFQFYRGDSARMPFVIEDEDKLDDTIDKDRIIKVPIQLKFMFQNDPQRALNDYAGYPYSNKDLLFSGDISHLMKCATIRNTAPEIITVDFYDRDDTIYDKVSTMIDMIPRMTSLHIHFDIGLKKDICGCAICYYDGERKDPNSDASYPLFRFPLIFGISRKKGQSTSLDHIYQFIKKLKERFILMVSCDSFASQGLFQLLERDQIPWKMISVDRTTDAYYMLKNVINTERITLPYNERLFRECSELRVVTEGNHVKVDHPLVSSSVDFDYKNATGEMPGTKDIADAVAGSLWSCYKSYSEYLEGGYSSEVNKQITTLSNMTKDPREETQKRFQDMLENIF